MTDTQATDMRITDTQPHPTTDGLKQAIRRYARDCGFDIVGFTTADAFERDEAAAVERVRDGLMDGLAWYTEERVRRANRPKALLDGAASVISLALSYNTGEPPPSDGQPRGKIARYAWGKRLPRSHQEAAARVCGRDCRQSWGERSRQGFSWMTGR